MNKELRRLIVVVVAILLLRIGLVNIYELFDAEGGFDIFEALGLILFDPINLPLTLSSTLLLGYLVYRVEYIKAHRLLQWLSWMVIITLCATLSTVVASRSEEVVPWGVEWYSLLFTSAILCAVILVVLYLWLWFRSSRRYMSNVLAKSERTNFQYTQLKRQLNPHFLFNSLSILDYLVQEQQTERASDYIKKLANIYRYLLKQEEYDTIELSKEVDFLRLYIDIMRERFLDGFEISIELSEEQLSRKVVPCALQVLVENAFKHNAVSASSKLYISVRGEKESIIVSNNINHKNSAPESHGFGLKNLRTQYELLAGGKVEIIDNKEHFTVKIPLL